MLRDPFGDRPELSRDEIAKRSVVADLWRKHYGHGPNVDLAGSETDWNFWVALIDTGRSGRPT